MADILLSKSAKIIYELIHYPDSDDYGITAYFEDCKGDTANKKCVTISCVSKSRKIAAKLLDDLCRLCALPCELPEIVQDLKYPL